jgi:hypothetical protein
MLPFLKPKRVAGVIIEKRKADQSPQVEPEDAADQGLDACSEELIRAMHAKDAKGVSAALRAAFEVLESQPHEEAEQE